MVEFRRTTNPAPRGSIRRKGVLLVFSLAILGLLVFLVIQEYQRGQPALIEVQWVQPNLYLVDADTTNFEELASTLREAAAIWQQQQRPYHIELQLAPQTANSDTLRTVLQLISAFDVPWQLN